MKSPKWVAMTRQLIKSNHGFGWSISGWEKNNKLITKVVYRYPDGSRNSILLDLNWASDNSKKMTDIIDELADLMKERNVDLAKAYELINGGKISKGIKKEINWEALTDEFGGSLVKALASLNQLKCKKLIYSKPKNFEGKGLVKIFYPNKK